jgi:Uri superfamily endonuclease
MIRIPPKPGSYALEFSLYQPQRLTIGRLGEIFFPQGEYIYMGSALGPGGLRARLGRHLQKDNFSYHWHIDYIKSNTETRSLCYLMESAGALQLDSSQVQEKSALPQKPVECIWSQILSALPYANIPAPGFGASDCHSGCRAHLIHFQQPNTSLNNRPLILNQASVRRLLADAVAISPDLLEFEFIKIQAGGFSEVKLGEFNPSNGDMI